MENQEDKNIVFNKSYFQKYLNYCEQLNNLECEYKIEKALCLAKANFALRYGKYLSKSQLDDLYSIDSKTLINRLVEKHGKTKLAHLNSQYLHQLDNEQLPKFVEEIILNIMSYITKQ